MIKRYLFLLSIPLGCLPAASASAQAADSLIAASYQGESRFRVNVDGGALFGGTFDGSVVSEGVPAEGSGTRMMWYPRKAAFRAGYINGTQWDGANIGQYSIAVGANARASGDSSAAFGGSAVAAGSATFAAGSQVTASGAASVALGFAAHTNARQGSFVFGDRSTVDTIRAGVNHSANWRVSGGFRVFTSSNLSTGVTIQSGVTTSNWGQNNAVISTSTGAYLGTDGIWHDVSDVNRKHAFEHVAAEDVLVRLRELPITSWSYRVDDASVRHLGPTAQDFYRVFRLGSDERTIGGVDAQGVALAGVQALDSRTVGQQQEIDALKLQNAELIRQNQELAARLSRLEALLARP
jgi:hypothetical protein